MRIILQVIILLARKVFPGESDSRNETTEDAEHSLLFTREALA